jgi:sugar lactone lactonase YvrE
MSIDNTDNLYVMDSGNRVIRKIAPTGDVSTLSGTYSAGADLVSDANGNVLVISGAEIYRISPDGTRSLLRTLPSGPDLPGDRNANGFSVDSKGTLHASYQGFRQLVISINQNDEAWGYTYIGGQMLAEHSVASDQQGNLAIAVSPEPEFGKRGILLIPASAQTETIRSTEGLPQIEFEHNGYIEDMVYDAAGNLYIADSPAEGQTSTGITISRIAPDQSVSTLFSGRPNTSGGSEPGIGIEMGIAVNKSGIVYFTDPSTHAIYKLNSSGEAVLVAGKPGEAGNAD